MLSSLSEFFTTQVAPTISNFSPATIFLNMFYGVIESWTNSLIQMLSSMLVSCNNIATYFLDMTIVLNTVKYAQALAFAIIAPKIILEAINTYLLFRSGDPDADITGTVIRAMTSTTLIIFGPWLAGEIFRFGILVATDISKLNVAGAHNNILEAISSMTTGLSLTPVIALVIVGAILIIVLQIAIRGAEMALMKVLIPIIALNLTSSNQGLWGMFLRQIISLALTQAIQLFLFMATLTSLMGQSGGNNMFQLLFVFGWLWITIKSPKIIKELTHSTGVNNVAHGAVNMVAGALVRKAV